MTELDEYHIAIQKLQTEIEKYRDAASTLEDVSNSLMGVHQASVDATAAIQESAGSLKALKSEVEDSLNRLSNEVTVTLKSIHDLNLKGLHADTQNRYDAHQARLDELGKAVGDAVREQQRRGLEMLQHSTTLQGELARYANQVEQSSTVWGERQHALESRVQSIAARTDATASQLSATDSRIGTVAEQVAQVNKLVRLAIVLVIIAGVISVAV
jgi:chromosome segregation ATPase